MQKLNTVLALLVCFHTQFLSIAQTGLSAEVSPPIIVSNLKNGEQVFIKYADECLGIIEKEANNIPMTGVAMVAFIPGDSTLTWISKMKVVGKLADHEVNLLGIVYTKAAEMAVTLQDSGNADRKNMRGEYGYQGGVIKKIKDGYLLCAFSGGKSADDVDAARKGLDWLAGKF